MILKLGMYYRGLKLYNVYINDDPGMTLTYFTARSNWVTYMFEWGKLLQSHLMEKTCSKRINVLMKNNLPQEVVRPCPGAIYMYMSTIFKALLI